MAGRHFTHTSRWLGMGLALVLGASVSCDRDGSRDSDGAPGLTTACDDGSPEDASDIADSSLAQLAQLAVVSTDPKIRAQAIAALRAAGPEGMQAFVAEHRSALATDLRPTPALANTARPAGLRAGLGAWLRDDAGEADPDALVDIALDAICQQHACRHTQLYWYTDLDRAIAAARMSGKPILSLRMLGELDEALSCANSRFFRSILYPAIAPWLRERFVLHWTSERPVPVVTVDYGDGRRLTRTITGNSVHTILDSDGRPVDAIPGLLAPPVFQRALERAAALALSSRSLDPAQRTAHLREHHRQRLADLDIVWGAEVRAIGEDPTRLRPPVGPERAVQPRTRRPPTAAAANTMAVGKMKVEMPMLDSLGLGLGRETPPVDAQLWDRLAQRHLGESALTAASLRAMNALETVDEAMRLATVRSLAADTLVNEHQLHRTVHMWFADGSATTVDLEALSRRIYDHLLLTPADDATLGLAPEEVYSGLHAGGWTGAAVTSTAIRSAPARRRGSSAR